MTKETYCLGVDLLPEFKKDFEFIESEYQALQNKLQTYRRVYENCPNFKKDIKSERKKAHEQLEGDINASLGVDWRRHQHFSSAKRSAEIVQF